MDQRHQPGLNTIHFNNAEFYTHLNAVVQYEAQSLLTPEVRGLLLHWASRRANHLNLIERMQRILADGVAIGNAQSRSIVGILVPT